MSNYTQITDFSAKDNLSSGDAEKIVLGADFDAEFAAISTAIASKVDTVDTASTTAAGIVELATSAETITGTDTDRAVTPAGLAAENTAARILAKLLTVDGAGSGLDADLLDGQSSAYYAPESAASDSAAGIVELATSAEVTTGTDTARAVTPASLAGAPGSNNIGYLNIPQNAQTGNYTLVIGDAGKHIYHAAGAGSGDTYTIPANASVAFAIGTAITFVNRDTTNSVSIAITSDTLTLAGIGSTGTRTLAAYGIATAIKVTSTEWMISGTGLS